MGLSFKLMGQLHGLGASGSWSLQPSGRLSPSGYRMSPPAPQVATSGFQLMGHTVSGAVTVYKPVLVKSLTSSTSQRLKEDFPPTSS